MGPHYPHSEVHIAQLDLCGGAHMPILIVPCHAGGWIFCRGNLPNKALGQALAYLVGLPNLLSTPIHPSHTPDFLSSGHFIPLFAGPLLTPTLFCS